MNVQCARGLGVQARTAGDLVAEPLDTRAPGGERNRQIESALRIGAKNTASVS